MHARLQFQNVLPYVLTYVYIEISTHIIMIDLVVILKINYT